MRTESRATIVTRDLAVNARELRNPCRTGCRIAKREEPATFCSQSGLRCACSIETLGKNDSSACATFVSFLRVFVRSHPIADNLSVWSPPGGKGKGPHDPPKSPSRLGHKATAIAKNHRRFTVFALVDANTRLTGKLPNAGERNEIDVKAASLLALAA